MNKFVLAVAAVIALNAGSARAAEKAAPTSAAKPNCAALDAAETEAKRARKDIPKPDYSSCKAKTGKERTDCVKRLDDKYTADVNAATDKEKAADTAARCCNNPKASYCGSSDPAQAISRTNAAICQQHAQVVYRDGLSGKCYCAWVAGVDSTNSDLANLIVVDPATAKMSPITNVLKGTQGGNWATTWAALNCP